MENHGQYGTRLYRTWQNMKTRCYNPHVKAYKNYGGRGIKVCDNWSNSFHSFYMWATENGYNDTLTLDRIDNNGDYSPENCRFVSYIQNNQNRRSNVYLEYNGQTHCVTEWARLMGIGQSVLCNRIKRGWSVEKALTHPVDHRRTRWGK